MPKSTEDPTQAPAMLSIFDGDMQPFEGPILVHIHNGQDVTSPGENQNGPNVMVKVPFHDGPGDFYAVSVSSPGYRDSGCFFKANPKVLAQPKVLLLRDNPTAQFAPWAEFKVTHPESASFLAVGAGERVAQVHYEQLSKNEP